MDHTRIPNFSDGFALNPVKLTSSATKYSSPSVSKRQQKNIPFIGNQIPKKRPSSAAKPLAHSPSSGTEIRLTEERNLTASESEEQECTKRALRKISLGGPAPLPHKKKPLPESEYFAKRKALKRTSQSSQYTSPESVQNMRKNIINQHQRKREEGDAAVAGIANLHPGFSDQPS